MSKHITPENIAKRILFIRGEKVLLDSDLAVLYGVSAKRLNEQVRRNKKRFPPDFMFRLTVAEANFLRSQFVTSRYFPEENQEVSILRSQIATLRLDHGKHRKYLPYVFTEQGVAMLSGVLNSDRAIRVNIEIMRAFVGLREILSCNKELSRNLAQLEKRYDKQFRMVFDAIRELMAPPPPKSKKQIGFLLK